MLALFPGAGHVYNGLYMRGVTFFVLAATMIGLADRTGNGLFGFGVAFVWIFNVLDSFRQASLMNLGLAHDLGVADLPERPRAAQGGILAGALLFLIGLVAVLDRYFFIRLDWVLDLWPYALMLIGGWIVSAAIRDRQRRERASSPRDDEDTLAG